MDSIVFQYTAVIAATACLAIVFICFSQPNDKSDAMSDTTDDADEVQEEVSDETDEFEEYIGERISSSPDFQNKVRGGLTKLRFRYPHVYAEVMRK